jgi:glycosyltransferase involved in cell wall biosynthesis
MTSPRVLVVVPTHDHPWALDLSVESALAQTVENLDIVVIGDGVVDETRDVVARLMERDDRIGSDSSMRRRARAAASGSDTR